MGQDVHIEDKLHADDGDLKSLIQELMQRVKILENRVEKLTIENKKLTRENGKLIRENGKLHLENKKLKDKYNHLKNISSGNSSTPPSKDPPYKPNTNKEKPNPKAASRKKDKKKKSNGGQKGHRGFRLEPVKNPDKTIFYYLDFTPDGMKLTEKDIFRFEERQEFEIPKPKIVVTAHRAAIYKHPITGKLIRAPFPKGLEGQTNYGPHIKAISGEEKEEWMKTFRVIVEEGSRLNPDPPDPPPGKKKRGRKKRTKGGNLVLRLKANEKGYTEFLSDFAIPFTNNDAERPIRMLKVQQKVSGCFREFTSSQQFLQIR